jgi:hypothetical protein
MKTTSSCSFRRALRGATALAVAAAFSAFAAHDLNTFELDRNALDSNAVGTLPDDWDTVNLPLPNGGGGHSIAHTGVISDPTPETSIFTTGGSKDDNDISSWKWKVASNILDKDNLTNAYAAAYAVDHDNDATTPPHLVVYFGLDRFSNDGSAQVGFWFFKNAISKAGDGMSGGGDAFNGVHANGDILVQSNFSQGGTVDTVSVYEWINGALVKLADGGDCIPGSANDPVCGTVNQGNQTAPWPYTPKGNVGVPGTFPQGTFFEGGIDMTALGLTDACFSTFMAESRSSTPFNSVLKDFVGPREFNTCNVEVTKACTNPRLNGAQDRIIYDIMGKVTAVGFGGNLHNIALSDSPTADGAFDHVDCADSTNSLGSFPLASLNGEACYKNTITVLLAQNGLSDTVTVTANTAADNTGTALSDMATAQCPNLQVSPALSVTKDCTTAIALMNNTVVAKVNVSGMVCNTGDSNLSNVSVDDLAITTSPDPLVSNISLATGACQNYSGSYIPSAANDANGNPTTCPADVVFKDTVRATAKDIFGNDVTPQTDMADCKLCPEGGCAQ